MTCSQSQILSLIQQFCWTKSQQIIFYPYDFGFDFLMSQAEAQFRPEPSRFVESNAASVFSVCGLSLLTA